MVVDGIVLASPSDMAACWPNVWSTEKAAERWRAKTTSPPIPIKIMSGSGLRYRHPGERQKWRSGWHDPAVCPDPRAWLEARLGPLAGFEPTLDLQDVS